MKHIFFVINSMDKAGGCERVVSMLSGYFFRMRYMVTIVALSGSKTFYQLEEGVKFITLDKTSFLLKGFKLVSLTEKTCDNVVIGIGMNKLNLWLASHVFLFNKKKTKIIAAEHINFTSLSAWQKKARSFLFKKLSSVIVLTKSNKEKLNQCGLNNVFVIPNVSSFEICKGKKITERESQILAVGRLEKQKNFSELIEIWGRIYMKFPTWKLLIVGEGSQYVELDRLIKQIGLSSKQCEILSFQNNINQFYESSQIVAMTSLYEGLPMALIEAMTLGCPCISYDCETGPRDIILDGKTGFLIDFLDFEQFQQKLETLISDFRLREKFSEESYSEAERFSANRILKKWVEIF